MSRVVTYGVPLFFLKIVKHFKLYIEKTKPFNPLKLKKKNMHIYYIFDGTGSSVLNFLLCPLEIKLIIIINMS